jgi:hypothetical protein
LWARGSTTAAIPAKSPAIPAAARLEFHPKWPGLLYSWFNTIPSSCENDKAPIPAVGSGQRRTLPKSMLSKGKPFLTRRGNEGRIFGKKSRHGSEMGVSTKQIG